MTVMFDFGNANDSQKQAIKATDGPVLITAGPGTGKTFTLVQRAIYLIQEKHIRPEEILMATFTEKAAKELTTRITNELVRRGISVNINEMYVGTFHSLCLRIIKEHLEYTRLKKNFRVLDAFDQHYTVFQNYSKFSKLDSLKLVIHSKPIWKQSEEICGLVNKLSEELVNPAELMADSDKRIAALGQIMKMYQGMLDENNMLDFSTIQTEAYWLLVNHPEVLSELRKKIRYIMIDEYQDTNYIQEQLTFLLGGEHENICVVGDDDQGLYRFRGATIRNILEFPSKFDEGKCKTIPLVVNYRSNSDIVDFYNRWMTTTEGDGFSFNWHDGRHNFRYEKNIEPHERSTLRNPAAVKLTEFYWDDWYEKILDFIQDLKASRKITDYNQIAFLFNSVKFGNALGLARYLEKNGISVYSPRSNMFFERYEIRLILGCLLLMFPNCVRELENAEESEYRKYCMDCIAHTLSEPNGADLRKWIGERGKLHSDMQKAADYNYSGLIYQMLQFPPFSDYLSEEMDAGLVNLRPARNIAMFTQIISKFEHLHQISVLDRNVNENTKKLFNSYLRARYTDGISEYEDDAEYAPSGCVSFLTIHQAKGMEFPIVVVDSLNSSPRNTTADTVMEETARKYFKRPAFEPYESIGYFDFWRLYYTAFSRAQDLLILTCYSELMEPSKYFRAVYDDLPDLESDEFDLDAFTFHAVKNVSLKNMFSFTSHISVYDTCARQYKMYKELHFAPVRVGTMFFGSLVHQTIEDIHKAVLRHEENLITEENITCWFDMNYESLSKSEQTYLAEPQKKAALDQVLRYAARNAGSWGAIREAEVDVSLVKKDYIIGGKIDLIKGEGDTVELVDFKTEKKPDHVKEKERIERYQRQLQVYAHLVEERTGHKVSKMHLYYTSDDTGTPAISFPYQKAAIDATVQEFDDTVHKIMRKEFTQTTQSPKVCNECDFRFYCKR